VTAAASPATRLADLVVTSTAVAGQSGRRAKIAALAELLRRLTPEEVEIGVAYLSGALRQGKAGIGYAALRDARPDDQAMQPELTLSDVDTALAQVARASGAGSAAERVRLLKALFHRATPSEYEFLVRLLQGELRQGALEGLMIEAVAAAAGVPAPEVRRAAMVAGGIGVVAESARCATARPACGGSSSLCSSRWRRCWRSPPTTSRTR
jgi:DNA ligase-1